MTDWHLRKRNKVTYAINPTDERHEIIIIDDDDDDNEIEIID